MRPRVSLQPRPAAPTGPPWLRTDHGRARFIAPARFRSAPRATAARSPALRAGRTSPHAAARFRPNRAGACPPPRCGLVQSSRSSATDRHRIGRDNPVRVPVCQRTCVHNGSAECRISMRSRSHAAIRISTPHAPPCGRAEGSPPSASKSGPSLDASLSDAGTRCYQLATDGCRTRHSPSTAHTHVRCSPLGLPCQPAQPCVPRPCSRPWSASTPSSSVDGEVHSGDACKPRSTRKRSKVSSEIGYNRVDGSPTARS